jgi:hypothetical protein
MLLGVEALHLVSMCSLDNSMYLGFPSPYLIIAPRLYPFRVWTEFTVPSKVRG